MKFLRLRADTAVTPEIQALIDKAVKEATEAALKEANEKFAKELEAKIAEARKQEKDKLYSTIEELKAQLKESQEMLERYKAEVENMKKDNNQGQQSEPAPQNQQSQQTQQAPAVTPEKIQELIQKGIEEVMKNIKTPDVNSAVQEAIQKAQLQTYRANRLAEAKIPEAFHPLVPVDAKSKEEIDEAVNKVVNTLQSLIPQPKPGDQVAPGVVTFRLPDAPGTGASGPTEITAEMIYNMTDEQFKRFLEANPHIKGGSSQTAFRGITGAGWNSRKIM